MCTLVLTNKNAQLIWNNYHYGDFCVVLIRGRKMVDDMHEFVAKDEMKCAEAVKEMKENEKLLIDLQFGIATLYDKLKDVKLKPVSFGPAITNSLNLFNSALNTSPLRKLHGFKVNINTQIWGWVWSW